MATAAVTPQTNTPAAAVHGQPGQVIKPAPTTPSAEPVASAASSESILPSGPSQGAESQSAELNPQDFDSLQDYAQALMDKKQSETADSTPAEQDGNDNQQTEAELQPQQDQISQDEAEDAQARVAQLPSAVDLDIDSEDFLSTKALNDRINANAALKQALEADQPLRNAMFRNARLASEAAGYREIFPDVESARMAANHAAEFAALDHSFLNADNRQGAEQFFSRWAQMAMLNDDNGNVLRDQYGNPRMHPAWSAVNDHLFHSQLDYVRNNAEKTGNHELLAALDVIRDSTTTPPREARAGDPGISPSSPALDQLPPHLQAAADSINRREQELTRRQQAAAAAEAEAFELAVGEEASGKINALVEPVLEKAALSDFVRQTAREKIESAIVDSLGRNRFFQARMAELKRFPMNNETMQQRLNLLMTHVHSIAGPIVRQVLRQASQPVMRAQEERRTKIEGQIARTRSEPKSVGGAGPMTGVNQRPEQLLATAREQLRDELGDEPGLQQVIERFARLKANR
jgi:hypothetical protein